MTWRDDLRRRSRSPAFLWRMVIAILLLGVLLGAVVPPMDVRPERSGTAGLLEAVAEGRFDEVNSRLDVLLDTRRTPLPELLDALPALKRIADIEPAAAGEAMPPIGPRLSAVDALDPGGQQLVLALWESLDRQSPSRQLASLAGSDPPVRHANWALGIYWQRRARPLRAAEAYEREGRFAEADRARRRAVEIYVQEQQSGALARLDAHPLYAGQFPPAAVALVAADRGQWRRLWMILPAYEWSHLAIPAAAMAVATAAFWLLFCLHAGQVTRPAETRWWLCLAGCSLGVVSIWPTDFLIFWQEKVWGLVPSAALIDGLRFYILGVGLREELSKLVCLMPLVPWLVRRGNPLETLIVSACVGLGFAAAENTQYFAQTQGASSVSRFLTANFFHMAATGLVGLAVVRACWHGRESAAEAVAVFWVIVAAHGLYDALIALPDLVEYQLGSTLIYVLLCYQFFHQLRVSRSARSETVGLTATFLFAVSCVVAITFVYVSAQVGWRQAGAVLAPQVLGMAVMVYLFLREMPETLVTV